MLIDNVLILLVGLDLLDEEFQSAAVSLEQHNSHARTRHPRRDWLEVRREVPWRGPGLGPHPGLPLVGGRALPSPSPPLARRATYCCQQRREIGDSVGMNRFRSEFPATSDPLLKRYQSSAIWGSSLPQQFRRNKPTLVLRWCWWCWCNL